MLEYESYDVDNLTDLEVDPDTLLCLSSPVLPVTTAVQGAIYLVIFLWAVPGNLLVGLVVGLNRRLLSPNEVYLFHLSVVDGLLGLTMPFWALASLHGWLFGSFLCKLLSLVMEANFYVSILFLTCISVDRYLVIVHATERRSACGRVVCGLVWVLGVGLAVPALLHEAFTPTGDLSGLMVCADHHDASSATSWRLATRALRHILGFLVPLVVMVTCYVVTVARLLHTRGFRKHRAMLVILAVVTAFLLCWAPYHAALISDTLMRANLVPFDCPARVNVDLTLRLTHGLALTHCCINPLLYAFIGEKFRGNLVQLVRRSRRLQESHGLRLSRSTSQTSEGNGPLI